MGTIKIIVAEDDPHIRMGLKDTLESENYRVVEAENGKEAVTLFEQEGADLLMLDIMMPEKSGYDVCREIRAKDKQVPIIMLTAKSEEIDKVVGLELGADDYVTKPFGIHELLARVGAVLRRSVGQSKDAITDSKPPFEFGHFEVDPKTFKLTDSRSEPAVQVDLSEREVRLLTYFYQFPGQVKSRDELLNAIWGIDYLGTTRTLDQHIAQLRKKVETDPSKPVLITTVHGVGYRYNPDV